MDQKRRIDQLETKVRDQIKKFWAQFRNDGLEAVRNGDPKAMADFVQRGWREIVVLQISLMTQEERAEFEQVQSELQAQL